jgi:hypothetical protein
MNFSSGGNITFGSLTTTGTANDPGDIDLTSQSSITGTSVDAHNDAHLSAGTTIDVSTMQGNVITLSAPTSVAVGFATVVSELDVASNLITLTGTQVPSTAAKPLIMNITGYNNSIAQLANVTIGAVSIIVDNLSVFDMNFVAMAPWIKIVDGYVGNQMFLTTPTERILVDDSSPQPSAWPTIQLYQPGGQLTMGQYGNANYSNTFVVWYNGGIASALSTYPDPGGSSFVRDIPTYLDSIYGTPNAWFAEPDGGWQYEASKGQKPVQTIGNGPAVNVKGLPTTVKLHLLGQ